MIVRIDRYGEDKMIVWTPWANGEGKTLAKQVHGGRWNPKHKGWVYPLTWQICEEVRKYIAKPLGAKISLEPAMKEWATREKAKKDDTPSLLSTEGWPLQRLEQANPKLYKAVYHDRPFQSRAIAFAVRERRMLIAHDPGLGKTLSAIGSIHEDNTTGLILVVGPSAAVNIAWPSLLAEWAPDDFVFVFGASVPPSEREDTLLGLKEWAEENPTERCWVLMNPHWIRMRAELDEYGKYVRVDKNVKLITAECPALFDIEWSAIISDESHQTTACNTGNAKKWSAQRTGIGALKRKENAILLSISGTPMRGKPENLYGQLNWLRPEVYTSYWKWVRRHFQVFESGDSKHGSGIEQGDLLDPDAFFEEASNVMYRVTKAEVAADLPPKMYGGTHLIPGDERSVLGVWLPMEGKQAKAYAQMVNNLEVQLEEHTMRPNGILAEYTRLKQFADTCIKFSGFKERKHISQAWYEWDKARRQANDLTDLKAMFLEEGNEEMAATIDIPFVGEEPYKWEVDENGKDALYADEPVYEATLPSNKFDWILQFLTDRDLVGSNARGSQKVILASQFTRVLNLFSAELEKKGCPNYLLTGETPLKERQRIVHEFQKGTNGAKVFLLNTKAGGTALTLDAADDVVIIDETFDPDDQLQVEDRAHRLSNTEHQVTIWYLRSLGTIEEKIGATTTEREAVCKGIMDGARGLDTKKLLAAK